MKKKVLIIAYYWPPAGGPGVQRWLKFVKYLPDFNIEPIVYVPENPNYPITDTTLLKEVADTVTILKSPIKEPYGWANTLSRKQTNTISSGIIPKEKKQSWVQKLMIYIRGNFFIPDARVGWVKPSVSYLREYISDNEIDTVITTGPPHSLHLIGKQLKEWKSTLHWFADFRDPWTTIGYHDKLRMTKKSKATHKRLEREVLNTADYVIVTSPGTKEEFTAITAKPVTVITNGYDDREVSTYQKTDKFVLSHIGSLLSDRNPQVLWQVLSMIVQENEAFATALQLQLVGKVSVDIIDSVKEYGLENHLDLVGYVSHNEAQRLQEQATTLLLIEINAEKTKGIIAGKLFEYLSARRPILALGPKNADIKTIIEETEAGAYVAYDELERLKTIIERLFASWQEDNILYQSTGIEQYHRRQLTERLATLLQSTH